MTLWPLLPFFLASSVLDMLTIPKAGFTAPWWKAVTKANQNVSASASAAGSPRAEVGRPPDSGIAINVTSVRAMRGNTATK